MPMVAASQPDENSTLYLLRLEYKPSFHFSLLLQIYANTLTNSAAHLRGEGVATDAPKCDRERRWKGIKLATERGMDLSFCW